MQQWYSYVADQTNHLCKIISKYDENQDGIFQLSEFKQLINDLEPGINNEVTFILFKESMAMNEESVISDAIEPKVLSEVILKYKLGGFGKEFFCEYLSKRKDKYRDLLNKKHNWNKWYTLF